MAGFFRKLFGGSDDAPTKANAGPDAIHEDVEIRANPQKAEGGQWRIAGTVTKVIDGTPVTRTFLRADLLQSRDEAVAATIGKAKLIIDQNGASLWKGDTSAPC